MVADPNASPTTARKHLVVAGTGRSGTSFLVRYLHALGLETGLARQGGGANWEPKANAGLENLLLVQADEDLPYVLKSPWIGEYIEEILRSRRIAMQALIVPMRDLVQAATSRSVLEHRSIHENHGWMSDYLDKTWEVFALTPGGVVYSLNPIDQARLLALSFHRLLLHAAEFEIPVLFPVFPKMVEDWEYLYRTLKPVLPFDVSPEAAREAHASVASASMVRVGSELSDGAKPETRAEPRASFRGDQYPSLAEVDNIALRRELRRLKEEMSVLRAKTDALAERNSTLEADLRERGTPDHSSAQTK